jgi:hypothetical protein
MMGKNARAFAPLPPVTLEDLVPPDHFYRHLERTLDLAFVRDLVKETYAETGRPNRSKTSGPYRRTADFRASATDPDASPMRPGEGRAPQATTETAEDQRQRALKMTGVRDVVSPPNTNSPLNDP